MSEISETRANHIVADHTSYLSGNSYYLRLSTCVPPEGVTPLVSVCSGRGDHPASVPEGITPLAGQSYPAGPVSLCLVCPRMSLEVSSQILCACLASMLPECIPTARSASPIPPAAHLRVARDPSRNICMFEGPEDPGSDTLWGLAIS